MDHRARGSYLGPPTVGGHVTTRSARRVGQSVGSARMVRTFEGQHAVVGRVEDVSSSSYSFLCSICVLLLAIGESFVYTLCRS